jgi:membrane-bound ClpP family serine protease
MEFLINPNVAYLLIITAMLILFFNFNEPKFTWLKAAMLFCFAAAGVELIFLKGNSLAFLTVAVSPLPFMYAIRQTPIRMTFLLLTILMLTMGAYFLVLDQQGRPAVNNGLAGFVSILCSATILTGFGSSRNVEGARVSDNPDSVVGLIGEVRTDIEPYTAGSVLVEGELWQARSKKPIPAGTMVRVLRRDGFWLTVKEVEKSIKQ